MEYDIGAWIKQILFFLKNIKCIDTGSGSNGRRFLVFFLKTEMHSLTCLIFAHKDDRWRIDHHVMKVKLKSISSMTSWRFFSKVSRRRKKNLEMGNVLLHTSRNIDLARFHQTSEHSHPKTLHSLPPHPNPRLYNYGHYYFKIKS